MRRHVARWFAETLSVTTVVPMSEQHSPSKDDVIRWLRANGAKWDRPNYYDLAADMLLGLSEQQEATLLLHLHEMVDNAEDFIGEDRGFPLEEATRRARIYLESLK